MSLMWERMDQELSGWSKIRGPTCNIVIVIVYLSHESRGGGEPYAQDVIDELDEFIRTRIDRHECVIILGDLNAK